MDFSAGTKVFEEALNAITFLDWLKKLGPAQNILGPVDGLGITNRAHHMISPIFFHEIFSVLNSWSIVIYIYTTYSI